MARRRGYEQVRDMTLSLGLVFLFVLVTVAFLGGSLGILWDDPAAREVRPVDYTEELRAAVGAADYEVLAPVGVPEDWVSQSARTETPERSTPPRADPPTVLLQIGFLTPDRRYATVVQSDAEPQDVLEAQGLGEQVEAEVDVAGQDWEQRRRVDRDELALVRTDGTRTVVVTGDAPLEDLRRLAAALEPTGDVPGDVPGGEPGGAPGDYVPIG